MHRVLIIKLGYSETLDAKLSFETSYGDVLRTTVILHLYRDGHVTWLTDKKAYPILKGNRYINRVLLYDPASLSKLKAEHFDITINLEKAPDLCSLADSIRAGRRLGFGLDGQGKLKPHKGSEQALSLCYDMEKKRKNKSFWQTGLYEMVGKAWQKEEYILGYKPQFQEIYDIGFNYLAGNKWPSKMWPESHWRKLEKLIGNKYTVSWQ